MPLARLKKSKAIDNAKSSGFIDPDSDYDVYLQDSDSDPEFNPGICEVRHCKDPVWSAGEECDILVCYDHFMEEVNTCGQHGKKNKNDKKKDKGKENTLVKNQVARQETTKKGIHHEEENNTSRGRQGGEEGDTTEIETGEGGAMVRGASMNEEVNRVEENGERETQNKPQRGRKRTSNEDNWTRNIKKRLKNSGKPYISSRGKEMAGKAIKVACSEKCTLKCSTKFSEEERKSLFEDFWASGDKREQHHFLLRHAEELPAKRMRVGCGKRSSTFHYYFYDAKKATRLEVCRTFFINTLDIKRELVYKVLRRQSTTGGLKPSCQGKHGKQKRIGEASLQGVRDHINSFPLVESHYCRKYLHREKIS